MFHNGLILEKVKQLSTAVAQSKSDLPSPVVVLQQLHFLTDQLNLSVFHGMDQNLSSTF